MERTWRIACIVTLVMLFGLYYMILQNAINISSVHIKSTNQDETFHRKSRPDFQINNSRKTNASGLHDRSGSSNFLIEEKDMCQSIKPDTFLLIYVYSAVNHSKHRNQIRKTYGSSKMYSMFGMSTLFFVGQSRDEETNRKLDIESQTYHDIIQSDFIDHYHNLTFKAISALSWITKHCNRVPFVLKLDDDVFVNVFNLIDYLKNLSKDVSSDMIYCRSYTTPSTSEREYLDYAQFCWGNAFFMRGNLIPKLNSVVSEVPFLGIDDIYVTGLLRAKTDIQIQSIDSLIALSSNEITPKFIVDEGLFAHIINSNDTWNSYWSQMMSKKNEELLLFV